MKPTKIISAPKPTPLPTAHATSGFPNCGLAITQENTYVHKTIFHFPSVAGAVDYAAFKNYADPIDAKQIGYYAPAFPLTMEVSQIFFPFQNTVESFDLVAYSATAVICVQRITFTTNYLV